MEEQPPREPRNEKPGAKVIDFRQHLNKREKQSDAERPVPLPRAANDQYENIPAEVTPISPEAGRILLNNKLSTLSDEYKSRLTHLKDDRLYDEIEMYALEAKEEIALSGILPSADANDPHWKSIDMLVHNVKSNPTELNLKEAQAKIDDLEQQFKAVIERIPLPSPQNGK